MIHKTKNMKPFTPHHLPLENLDWSKLIDLMGKANRYVARYDGLLQSIPNPDVLLSPLRTKEAVLSSKIEGTQATLQEVLEFEANQPIAENKKGDIHEIINYRISMNEGREKMKESPLSLNLIRKLHRLLMRGVRGNSKDPGEFRRLQNWIGPTGSTIETARFVPPNVNQMKQALYNWEEYLHYEENDIVVQLAIVHAQFEIIHPFLDGNGRIGRILIPLFLFHKKVNHEPVFYMSEYLETNRREYYDALKSITDKNDWTEWIRFFLEGIIYQAENNMTKTREIIDLYEKMKEKIADETHSQFAIKCLDFIFTTPIFSTTRFRSQSGIPKASTARLLNTLEACDIIACIERGAGRRPGLYLFRELYAIINK